MLHDMLTFDSLFGRAERHSVSARLAGLSGLRAVLPVLLVAACTGQSGTGDRDASLAPGADRVPQVAYGARLTLTDSGLTRGILSADSARIFSEGVRFDLFGVSLVFTDSLGDTVSVLSAGSARYDVVASALEFRDSVAVAAADGKSLHATTAGYSIALNVIHGDGEYSTSADGKPVRGGAFSFYPSLMVAEVKPADAMPAEAKPAEAKPADAKQPTEAKPGGAP